MLRECPTCLTHHGWDKPCQTHGLILRLQNRIREQEDELRALRAITRPDYMTP